MFERHVYGTFIDDGSDSAAGGDSIDEAIKKTVDAEKGDKKVDPAPKKDGETKKDEPTEEELEELAHAQNLVKVLKDPIARKAFVQSLVEKEGIDSESTQKDIKKAKRNIESIVKEGLGDEYSILNDRFAKILKEVLDLNNEENVKPIRDEISKKEDAITNDKVSTAYDKVIGDFKEGKSLETELSKLVNEFPPGAEAKKDPEKYFRRLIKLAAEEKGVALTKISPKNDVVKSFDAGRRNANKQDASSRLASEGADDEKVKQAPQDLTIEQAIAKAAKEIEAGAK